MIQHIRDNTITDISEIVSQINWQGSKSQLARRLDITLFNTFNIEPGDALRFIEDAKELFQGIVFTSFETTENTSNPYAFDNMIYLDKSKDDYKFTNTTDKKIIETLCQRFSIPIGIIEGTKKIDKLIQRNKGVSEIINNLGSGYNLFFKEGKLYREKKGKTKLSWVLDGNVLISGTVKKSIEDLKNSIKVIEGEKISTIRNDALISKYGLLQEVIEEDVGKGVKIAQDMLRDLGKVLKETDINCKGFSDAITGVYVDIEIPNTNIKGTFEILSDTHTYDGANHTMSLTLGEVV